MSEFIDEKIILNNLRRNYYTNSNTAASVTEPAGSAPEVNIETDRTAPAGIPPTNQGENTAIYINYEDSDNKNSDVTGEDIVPVQPHPVAGTPSVPASGNAQEILISYVRFYNLIPNSTGVNIYVNGREAVSSLGYEGVSGYMSVAPGIYTVEFYSTGEEPELLYEYRLRSFAGMGSTVAISANNGVYSVTDVSGSAPKCFYNTAYIRFAQLVNGAPAMDIYVDGIAVIAGLRPQEVSAYIGVPNGVHTIKAAASGTGLILIDETNNFPASSVTSLYIITDAEGNYGLSAITDQNSCS